MRRRPGRSGASARRLRGFSLVEVIISMSLLMIVMSSLAALTYTVTERGKANEMVTKRTFALQHETGRFTAIKFADLASQTSGSDVVLLGDFQFERVVTVTAVDSVRYTIKIVVIPEFDPTRKDSVVFDRTKPLTGTPLCTIC